MVLKKKVHMSSILYQCRSQPSFGKWHYPRSLLLLIAIKYTQPVVWLYQLFLNSCSRSTIWFLKFKSENNTPLLIFTIWTSTRHWQHVRHENICGLNVMLVTIAVHYQVPIKILSTNHWITGWWVFWLSHSATIWELGLSAFSPGTTTI